MNRFTQIALTNSCANWTDPVAAVYEWTSHWFNDLYWASLTV